jgi:AcrR family transcriptional regulator
MATEVDRRARSDAVRNADRIVRAARLVFADQGPEAQLSAVAERAGVGERTLYRHFPTKSALLRAALDQSIGDDLSPAIERWVQNRDALQGLAELVDAAISLGAREHCLLEAARKAGALTDDVSSPLYGALHSLMSRAQADGLLRPDLVPDDLPRIIAMLHSVLWTMDPTSGGWRRYLDLVLDAISTAPDKRTLRAAPELRVMSATDNWPI